MWTERSRKVAEQPSPVVSVELRRNPIGGLSREPTEGGTQAFIADVGDGLHDLP